MKNLTLQLLKVTEDAALAASKFVGSGKKEEADKAATEAMRFRLQQIEFGATVAIGEGKKDKSHGLFEGENLGVFFTMPSYDLAVDPIEGTRPCAEGGYEAVSVIALAEKGSFYRTESFYMEKLACGPNLFDILHIGYSVETNIRRAREALGRLPTVCVLDRDRNRPLVNELRRLGCRIYFIQDCDVTACIACCREDSPVDIYWSIGGAPEAIIAAAAMKCLGGWMQCVDNNKDKPLSIEDLAAGDVIFSATGITDGKLLRGVRYKNNQSVTHSLVLRSGSQTSREIETCHGN